MAEWEARVTPSTPTGPATPYDMGMGARAGLVAGGVFLVLEMIMVPLFLGGSAWDPVRLMASIVMGRDVVVPPATFDALVVTLGLAVHFSLSAFYGAALAPFIGGMAKAPAVIVGAIFGVALYAINFHVFTLPFPWVAMARNWVTVVTHIVFGLVAASVYTSRLGRVLPFVAA